MIEFRGKVFKSEDDLEKFIEETTDYDVLGIFEFDINVIDRFGNDGKEESWEISRY